MDETQRRLTEVENKLKKLEDSQFHMSRFLDKEQKSELGILMTEQILDTVWDDYFYYHTFFESLDGWPSGAGTISVSGNRLFMQTSGTDVSYAKKKAIYQNVLSYDVESRFRSSFSVDSATENGAVVTLLAAYAGVGHAITGGSNNLLSDGMGSGKHYGFLLDESTLYGITSDGTNFTTIRLLENVKFGSLIGVQALFYPRSRVEFYTTEQTTGATVGNLIRRGSISKTLPYGQRLAIGEFSVASTGGTRQMNVGFCEIANRRKK